MKTKLAYTFYVMSTASLLSCKGLFLDIEVANLFFTEQRVLKQSQIGRASLMELEEGVFLTTLKKQYRHKKCIFKLNLYFLVYNKM